MDEKNKFLEDLEIKDENTDVFDKLFPKEEVVETPAEPEEDTETKLRNRREKRLAEKLQAERESSIRLAERLATITEAQKLKAETDDDYLKAVEKIYGTETPEAVTATELLKNALKGVGEKATERALEKFREEQRQAQEAVKNEEKQLDSMVEEIEDENNLILTDAQKKGFFALLEKMSPKDGNGQVIHFADPHAVWEVYQSKTPKTENRAKDLSSRSMVQSGASKESKLENDALERLLREEAII